MLRPSHYLRLAAAVHNASGTAGTEERAGDKRDHHPSDRGFLLPLAQVPIASRYLYTQRCEALLLVLGAVYCLSRQRDS